MAIPQLGEIPPAPPPPPKRAPPPQGKLKRIQSKMQNLTSKTNPFMVKFKQWFFSAMMFFTVSLQHSVDNIKRWINCYPGNIVGFGPSTVIVILIVWSFSNGGKEFFSLLGRNSTAAGSPAALGPPGLVIGVLSSRDNFMQRQAVRHTWAAKLHTSQHQEQLPSQLVFVLGDQDCSVHPRLRASNPNHCPPLPEDAGTPAADGEGKNEEEVTGEYDEKWPSMAASNAVGEGSSGRPRLQQDRCLAGLGVRTLTHVMLMAVTVPYTEQESRPRVFFSTNTNNGTIELELELDSREGEGPVWVVDDLQLKLQAGLEFEVAVTMEEEECLENIRNKQCEWRDGGGSVQYTHVMHSDGSARPWHAHHCLPFTLHFENGAEQCPPDWFLHHDHCYHFSKDRKSWQAAQAECEGVHSSDLATVHDDSTNHFLLHGGKAEPRRHLWIGLHSLAQHNHFEWVDHSDVNYTNWDSYEPNNMHSREQCVELLPYSGVWNDNFCTDSHHYVCQKKRMSENGLLRRTLTRAERRSLQHSWQETRSTVQENVLREQKLFGDLLLVPGLVDTYGSLPDKLKALIQWSDAAFPGYWLLKTDDDTHVSLRRVLDVISQATAASVPAHSSPLAASRCPGAAPPPAVLSQFQGLRSVPRLGKWRELEYTGLTFPEFPAGGGYILTGPVVSGLAAAAPSLRSYQGEDVSLGVWLSSLTFPCPPSTAPHPSPPGARGWQEAVVRGGSWLLEAAAPVLQALKQGLAWLFEALFLARVTTVEPSAQPYTPPVLLPPSPAPVPHSPALLISVSCWLRSESCQESYAVAPNLSIDRLDALHKASISR